MIARCIGSRCETSLGTKLLFIEENRRDPKERALNRSYVVRRFFRSDLGFRQIEGVRSPTLVKF